MYPMLLLNHTISGEAKKTNFKYTADINREDIFLLSGRDEGESEIKNGDFAGLGINEALKLLTRRQVFTGLPIYIKHINTSFRLPVTVYPEGGKTSLIYITDCVDGAEMVYGFSRNTTRDELMRRVSGGSLSAVCNFVPVQKGDVFFIPDGVVFAVGSGISAIEISTNAGEEYIVSDYGKQHEGIPGRTNTARAVEVMTCKKIDINYGAAGEITLYPFGTVREIGSCDEFSALEINMDGNAGFYEEEKNASAILLSGEIDLSYSTGTAHLKTGDSLLLPPKVKSRLSGRAQILYTKF